MRKDRGSNRQFVLKEEFDLAIDRNNQGEDSDKSSMREKVRQKIHQISESVRNYKPQGENEKKALSIFTSLL